MSTLLACVFGVVGYVALTRLAPTRIGARVGFWVSVLASSIWAWRALDAALGHKWVTLPWDLFVLGCCISGAWAWADELRRDRGLRSVRTGGAA